MPPKGRFVKTSKQRTRLTPCDHVIPKYVKMRIRVDAKKNHAPHSGRTPVVCPVPDCPQRDETYAPSNHVRRA
jgi:hypothetical protein